MFRYSLTLILSICFLSQNFSQINSLKNIVVKSKKKLTEEKINKISTSKEELLNNKYLLVQKGKKNYIVLSFD